MTDHEMLIASLINQRNSAMNVIAEMEVHIAKLQQQLAAEAQKEKVEDSE